MEYLKALAANVPEYRRLASNIISKPPLPAMVTGLSYIQKAHFLAALCDENIEKPLLVLVDAEGVGMRLCDDINTMSGRQCAVLYPAKDLTLTDVDVVSREYEHRRLDVLYRLATGTCEIVVATPEAAAQLTLPRETLLQRTIRLNTGEDISLEELAKALIAAGFSRTDMIEGASQFSIRGSIADIFPINSAKPIRIELWGDTIEQIAYFDPETQRREQDITEIAISPAFEVLFGDKAELYEKITALMKSQRGKRAEQAKKLLSSALERLDGGISLAGTDKFLPLAYDEPETIFNYVRNVIICENSAVNETARAVFAQHAEDIQLLFEQGMLCRGLDRFMLSKTEFADIVAEKLSAYLENFARGGNLRLGLLMSVNTVQTSPWGGEYKLLEEDLSSYLARGYSCLVYAGTEKGARNLASDLRDDGFAADYSDSPKKLLAKKIFVTEGTISAGFDYPDAKCAVFTRTQVTVQKKAKPKRKKGEEIRSLTDISIGDLVVHYAYGIGVFDGVIQLNTQGILKDYIKIKYAGTDILYVPVTQLDLISRYIGTGDAGNVKLNKLNSDQWVKTKAKAKAAAKELASELIELYAKRMKSKGHAFTPDDTLQEEFENHFNYIETDSQIRCIDEIKADMQREMPMDRLLCGDVGFGKTEVALRAAFKCIADGKQCALLVPTTVLAWQHFQTAIKRMEGFPLNIELLSRFRTAKEKKEILKRLKAGEIDFIIGTHSIVQSGVEFKDLGLVIIDEEQRFGVAHKEKLKEQFSGVDVLTLSATPIPRTLNMAMSKLRDMSVLDEPPQDRHPVTTYVQEHDWGLVAQAISKELRRNGQVYYVHNRIESIKQCAAKIQELLPEARIGVAHGKMSEEEMLEVWRTLLEREIDVLVCTTLIETGVDVPNCNTLIIENADYMGLAQLHQLRGRVGRTSKRAFAYFTFKRGKVLSEIATKRLDAIKEFTRFGSGFRIALRDLEIRGAGSILGSSQSGHLANVGYDMYLQLLNEAVQEEQGIENTAQPECLVDIKLDAFIPEDYISNQAQRIDCYRKIAMIKTADDALDVTDELLDRYGEPPKSVRGLVDVALIRNNAAALTITEIIQNENDIIFKIARPDMRKISRVAEEFGKKFNLNMIGDVFFKITLEKSNNPLAVIRRAIGVMLKEDKD